MRCSRGGGRGEGSRTEKVARRRAEGARRGARHGRRGEGAGYTHLYVSIPGGGCGNRGWGWLGRDAGGRIRWRWMGRAHLSRGGRQGEQETGYPAILARERVYADDVHTV